MEEINDIEEEVDQLEEEKDELIEQEEKHKNENNENLIE